MIPDKWIKLMRLDAKVQSSVTFLCFTGFHIVKIGNNFHDWTVSVLYKTVLENAVFCNK